MTIWKSSHVYHKYSQTREQDVPPIHLCLCNGRIYFMWKAPDSVCMTVCKETSLKHLTSVTSSSSVQFIKVSLVAYLKNMTSLFLV